MLQFTGIGLEASSDVPKLTVVMERLLHEETKMKSQSSGYNQEALMTKFRKKQRCHFSNKYGHVRRDCKDYARVKGEGCMQSLKVKQGQSKTRKQKTGAFKITITAQYDNSSENEGAGLIVQHAYNQ